MKLATTSNAIGRYAGILALAAVIGALGACGGGGGSTPPAATPAKPAPPPLPGGGTTTNTGSATSSGTTTTPIGPGTNGVSAVAPGCATCSAISATRYSGAGTGVWFATNSSSTATTVPISLSGLTGQTVELVYTNSSATSSDFSSVKAVFPSATATAKVQADTAPSAQASAMSIIRAFNQTGLPAVVGHGQTASQAVNHAAAPVTYSINSPRNWYDAQGNVRNTTLVRQQSASDGTVINLWVEDGENSASKVSSSIMDSMINAYAKAGGVYDMVTSIGGKLWGPTDPSTGYIADSQPINLVILNLTADGQPNGELGYFYALNNLTQAAINASTLTTKPQSNQALAVFLDSETLYLGNASAGQMSMMTVMAHESTHMQNFFRRDVSLGIDYAYATWLEEQTAMMMEDWVSFSINPQYNTVRDQRAPSYVAENSYNCSMTAFQETETTCDTYSVNGTFGGFLNRQLGLAFYKDLLTNSSSTDSQALLDNSIQKFSSSTSFTDAVMRFDITMGALIPAAGAPPGYSFPPLIDSGFSLPQVDPSAYVAYRTQPVTPSTINPLASFPIPRGTVNGAYSESVPLPPGVRLNVVIH